MAPPEYHSDPFSPRGDGWFGFMGRRCRRYSSVPTENDVRPFWIVGEHDNHVAVAPAILHSEFENTASQSDASANVADRSRSAVFHTGAISVLSVQCLVNEW